MEKKAIRKLFRLAPLLILAICGVMQMLNIYAGKTGVSNSIGNMVYKLVVRSMNDNNNIVAYASYSQKKEPIIDVIADSINSSITFYSFAKDKQKEIMYVVYDPNDISQRVDMVSVAEVTSGDNEGKKNEEPTSSEEGKDNKPDVAEVFGPGILKLVGNGSGIKYSVDQLNFNFLMSNLYVVPSRSKVIESDLEASTLLSKDMSIEKNSQVPQILIYHTHSMEGFTDTAEGDNNTTNIVAVGTYLSELLSNGYGYNVIHCTQTFDYINGKLDRSKAYTYSREALQQILADNPSIEVVLDIHRDGVNEDLHLVTEVNGKRTAQIMFFNGMSRTSSGGDIDYLYNRYRSDNLALSFQMKLLAEEYFPNFTRRNYLDAYQYNLDLKPRSMLIEVGAQNNSFGEAKNAMEPLAALLDKILSPTEIE